MPAMPTSHHSIERPGNHAWNEAMEKGNAFHFAVNVRTLGHATTGVQRYVSALLPHMGSQFRCLAPDRPMQGIGGHLWEQFVLPRKLGGDLLWSPGNTGPITVGKQVVTLHDAATLDHPEWFEYKFARWYNWMLPKLARKAARIITVSAHAKSRIVEKLGLDENKVVAIHNGVDPTFQPQSGEAIAALRNELELPQPFFLYVGSLEPRKNLARLMEAWASIKESDFLLVVVGTSGHVFQQSGLASAPNVRFLGRVEDKHLPTLYSAAHAFIFPSTYEGFGLTPLEAMACGCPVLSSSATSLPEVCGPVFDPESQPGGAVLYFDPGDIESIRQSIVRMMGCAESQRQQMSLNARRRAARFSWESTAAITLGVLEETASQPA